MDSIKYLSVIFSLVLIQEIYPNVEAQSLTEKSSRYSLIDSLQDYKYTQPERAISLHQEFCKEKIVSGDYPKVESAFYNHLGEIYLRMNLPAQALSYYIEAKRLVTGNKTPWLDVQFGNVYFNQGQWIKAKEAYNKALEIFPTGKYREQDLMARKLVVILLLV